MTFLHVLIIFFCSPLFFLLKGRWLGFVFNAILYGLALFLAMTIVFFLVGAIFWLIGVAHGFFSLRKDAMKEQATAMARAMAAEMTKAKTAESAAP